MGLGILCMGPLETEVAALEEIAAPALTLLVVGVRHGEAAVELVVDLIPGVDVHRPRSQGIDVAGNREVQIISENEIHARIARVEASGLFLAEGRHQHARGALRLLRNETERKDYGEVHSFDDRMRRTEHSLLRRFGDHLGRTELQVIVRFIGITHGILAIRDIDGTVGEHLDVVPVKDALVVIGGHIGDAGLLGVEVVPHLLHLIPVAALFHHGKPGPFAGLRVLDALGEHFTGIHVVLHVRRCELHVLVGHLDIAVIIDHPLSVGEDLNDGIPRA